MAEALAVQVSSADLAKMYKDLRAAGGTFTVEMRHGIKAAATPSANAVRAAAAFSSRIPGAVKVKVTFSGKKAGATIIVDPKIAPEAAPINNGGKGGTFRHPVHANPDKTRDEWTWTDQTAVPFFDAPIRAHFADADKAMLAVLDTVARKAGFR